MAKRKEGRVEDYFIAQVEAAGGITRKAKWLCRRGCPDRFWAFPVKDWDRAGTRAVSDAPYRPAVNGLAEIKHPDGALEPHQEREITKLRKAGVTVMVLSSFEDVDYFIRSVA